MDEPQKQDVDPLSDVFFKQYVCVSNEKRVKGWGLTGWFGRDCPNRVLEPICPSSQPKSDRPGGVQTFLTRVALVGP